MRTIKSYLGFSWKELKAQKITAALILIAVIMSTIMTTVAGQSIGILQSMRVSQASALNGNRYAAFHQLTKAQAEKLYGDDRLYDVGDVVNIGNAPLGNSSLTLYLREYHGRGLELYPAVSQIQEGRLPESAGEIALSEETLEYLGLDAEVGDKITLDLSVGVMDGSVSDYSYSADFLLTGILKESYVGYVSGIVDGVVGNGTGEQLLPQEFQLYSVDFKTYDKGNFQEIVNELAASLGVEEKYIQYNWLLLNALGIENAGEEDSEEDSGFSYMMMACILVGALVLLAAGLVIYNILKISVAKRIREYGTLRAVGGTRGQIYRLVSLQLLILCGIGIPAGLILGVLSSKAVLSAATGLLNPELFLVESREELTLAIHSAGAGQPLFLALSAAVTLMFAVAAAFPAARYASHVSPTVAMAGQTVKIRRRVRRNKKIRNFEAYYARLNLKRGRARTAITILSLVMSITVFVALNSFTDVLDTSRQVQEMHKGDYAVTNETGGISAEAVEELRQNEAVEELATVKLSLFVMNGGRYSSLVVKGGEGSFSGDAAPFETDLSIYEGEALHIVGLDGQSLLSQSDGLTEEDEQAILDGTACIIQNPLETSNGSGKIPHTELKTGDTVTIGGRELRVAGLSKGPVQINNEGFVNGVQIIANDEVYDTALGTDRYSEVYPVLKEGTDTEAFESWLDGWCMENAGTHWISYLKSDEQMAESFEQIRTLCWVLIIFISIIGILNIINTVYSNIHTRIREIGVQRAVGMSAAGLYKTFLWEGAYYGIFAAAIGSVTGYICCVFVGAATTDTLQLVAVPVVSIVEAAVVSVAACLAATAVPLRAIAKMDIVESIENVE